MEVAEWVSKRSGQKMRSGFVQCCVTAGKEWSGGTSAFVIVCVRTRECMRTSGGGENVAGLGITSQEKVRIVQPV